MNAYWVILTTLPVTASPPETREYVVDVDAIVINRVLTVTTTHDVWGRPIYTSHEQCWISFWMDLDLGPLGRIPFWIDRGWVVWGQCHGPPVPSTAGWCLYQRDGITVFAKQLYFVESNYDWEMKHRNMHRYCPIKKP